MLSTSKLKRSAAENRDRLALMVARIVSALWVVSFVLQSIPGIEFKPPPGIDPLMVLTAGFLYAKPLLSRGNNGNGANS